MSSKAPHASNPVGAAGLERLTEDGRKQQRVALLAQALYYRLKRDPARAADCERRAEELQ